jgi:single-strand DNA-binding protein
MINNVTLTGRLVADAEMRVTTNNKSVVNFRIAVDRAFSKNKEADFITIVAWEKTADFVHKYFHKGDMIGIVGSIQSRNYEDSNGNKRTATEVVAKEVSFCGGKNEGNNSSAAPTSMSAPAPTDFEEIGADDELPF